MGLNVEETPAKRVRCDLTAVLDGDCHPAQPKETRLARLATHDAAHRWVRLRVSADVLQVSVRRRLPPTCLM